jgi:hypothetical protein
MYIFFKGIFTDTKNDAYQFKELTNYSKEFCLSSNCGDFYKLLANYIITNSSATSLLGLKNITFKTSFNDEPNPSGNDEEWNGQLAVIILAIIVAFFTVVTIYIEMSNDKKENNAKKSNFSNSISSDDLSKSEILLLGREKTYRDRTYYKIFSAFNIFKNLFLLTEKKEILSDQTSLIELSTLRLISILFIILSESIYIIFKYLDPSTSLKDFLSKSDFILVKIGTIAYEHYKIISGIILGYKFINQVIIIRKILVLVLKVGLNL